ncbi:ABC transporter [Phlyctema vagabunda]|uniref:ABC transporter n=1 Tax=Phlyctema vagabunda TaxID=108571 RepID=A0ABR4PDL4_9HELO
MNSNHPQTKRLNESDSTYEMVPKMTNHDLDIEQKAGDDAQITNSTVQSFAWQGINVTVKDHKTKQPKLLLDNVDGVVEAGNGCGKTTLLNVLAHRDAAANAKVEGETLVNGSTVSTSTFRQISSYVEQEDALIGSLTVRETLHFAARLAHTNTMSKSDRLRQVEKLLDSFGLRKQANALIGTPIRKGISGGQKRRTSVASQLIKGPKIMFLDEPTSGLDSSASWEVMSFVKAMAKQYNLIVIASIHQPSTTTFELFDKLLLLSGGKTHYFGAVAEVTTQFEEIDLPIPSRMNPAEFLLDIMNIDFSNNQEFAESRLQDVQRNWIASSRAKRTTTYLELLKANRTPLTAPKRPRSNFIIILMTLVHRAFIKSYRDVVAYGIRILMYTGLAIMMGTVWLRLHTVQEDIQPYINAIFFGSAFMSFMAVAYVPSFLEDRATFIKERANGLYGATAFMISNFIIGLPYLFLIAVLFSCIVYFLTNLQPTARAFFMWIMWLFLDLLAAESLVVLISSIFPVFVISLALTAFANGLWMSVGGFLVPRTILNVFWRYVFHYIDYQSYVFQGMMVNEFEHRTYRCGEGCSCMYQTELASECRISGTGVLDQYGYKTDQKGQWIGILLAIIICYRILGWVALAIRK